MSKKDFIEVDGIVKKVLPGSNFIVELSEPKIEIEGFLSGKMRQNHIRVLVGDKVKLELSPYDLTKGRITYRFK